MNILKTDKIKNIQSSSVNLYFILHLLLILILFDNVLLAQDFVKKNLKGLKNVLVTVEIVPDNGTILSQSSLQTKIEMKLRLAKIKVIDSRSPEYNWSETPDLKLVIYYIEESCSNNSKEKFYAPNLSLSLFEYLKSSRANIEHYYCMTWTEGNYGIFSEKFFADRIDDSVDDFVNSFINDYLRDNQ